MEYGLVLFYFIEAIWFILPAYAANGFAPLFKGKVPIDGGRRLKDGKRIFGDGKTVKGFIGGCVMALVVGLIQMLITPYIPWDMSPVVLRIIYMTPVLGFLLGFGALAGDMVGSFVKRRMDLKRGEPAPLLDQVDFLVGALFFTFLIADIKAEWAIVLLIVTPLFHLLANVIGYLIKIKKEPY
ncbi:MAG: CDP-2,3-bis-(O-geranylgeranyl)-sn-glycerol synthase [Candidatus Aenigmarchaeota archaeon]|nr:CDP-2,3-bis-(O-geranylgeranyl)-sn-glycerol synthase [Candidatus Aenigmarchaeota archaeon]